MCAACKETNELASDVVADDELLLPAHTKVMTPRGCAKCRGTGYKGRTGMFEVIEVTDDIRELIKSKATAQAFREVLRKRHVPSIRQVGVEMARAGVTTIDEVLRVT